MLKGILRKFVSHNQKDWDEYLPCLPREGCTEDQTAPFPVTTYVVEMRQRLAQMAQLVAEHTAMTQKRQKQQYEKGTKQLCFEVEYQVLVLCTSINYKQTKMYCAIYSGNGWFCYM